MESIKKAIEALCETANHQEELLVGIYKVYIDDFDRIEKIQGFPICGRKMWLWICDQFIAFDKRHHPEFIAGGIWMNNGFSSNREIGDWEVSLKNCSFEYKQG